MLPGIRRVALFAIRRVAGVIIGVPVVLLVAAEAIAGCAPVTVVRVTGDTVNRSMSPGERISCGVVIEGVIFPA